VDLAVRVNNVSQHGFLAGSLLLPARVVVLYFLCGILVVTEVRHMQLDTLAHASPEQYNHHRDLKVVFLCPFYQTGAGRPVCLQATGGCQVKQGSAGYTKQT